nr:Ig-like domain-containing protein [Lysinibacter cavernae]
MGNVSIEYSDDAPEDIAAALLQPENSDGHSGITWKTGTVPSSATALRFVTEKPIESGFSGSATITVALKGLAIGGQLKNDFYGKTAAVDGDQNSVKRIVGAAEVTLASSAGSLAGSVWRDLDFDGGFSPADVAWPAGSKTLTITSANETYTTNIGSNGSFDFGVIAAGDYVASVKDARGWSLVLSHPITFGVGDVVDDARILFQEQLAPLALKPDTGSTSAGASTVVDVKTNDSWVTAAAPAPQTFSSIQAGGEPTFGTASITADGKLTYASAADWPAAFDGQTSYEDTVTYSVTDSAGLTATTVVTLTIYAAPVAVDDTITIGQSGKTALDALANDTGHTITFDGDIVSTSDVRVSEDGDKVSVESLHVWADGEATFVDTVAYTISDEFGQVSTASIVVTVQRAPVVTVDAGQVIASGGEAVFTPQLLNPGVVSDDDRTVSKRPSAGTVTMEDDGTVSFVPGNAAPGDYSFEITYTDDLGQATTQAFTVTVYAALQLTNDRATVPWISPTAIDVLANDAGDGLVLLRAQVIDGAETEGTIEVTADGLKFTPSPDREWAVDELSYIETLEYTAADGHGDEATATLTLTVIRPPVGKDVHLDLSSDVESVTFDPVGEATGTDIQGLSKDAVVTKPVHGTASILAGELTYTPEAGFIGDDNFTVRLVDAFGQTGEVTYTFTIVAAKAPEEGGNGVEPHEGAGGGGTGSAEGNNGNGGMPGTPETAATDSGLALTGTGSAVWSLGALCLAAGFALWLFASARSRRQPALGSSRQA